MSRNSASSFRDHLERLIKSTSVGAICNTDEQALQLLEQRFSKQSTTFTNQDVEHYLQDAAHDLKDGTDDADHANEQSAEPEVSQWLRQ
jgi:hypothetical protein